MGIKSLNKTYIKDLRDPANEDRILGRITHMYIDATELIYTGMDRLKARYDWEVSTDTRTGMTTRRLGPMTRPVQRKNDQGVIELVDTEVPDEEVVTSIMNIVESTFRIAVVDFMRIITSMKSLESLVVGFDGVPCHGKIQNQITRRKTSNDRYYYKDQLLFSSAMVLPGTRIANTYINMMKNYLEMLCTGVNVDYGIHYVTEANVVETSTKFHKVSFYFSSNDIAGEAEHKILALFRSDIDAGKLVGKTPLVWSSDSDTIVAMIGDINIQTYVYTHTYTFSGGELRKDSAIVSLDMFKNKLMSNGSLRQYKTIMLLIELLGNDYLPEMLDTVFVGRFMDGVKAKVFDASLDLLVPFSSMLIINTSKLCEFFQAMSANELSEYCTKRMQGKVQLKNNPLFEGCEHQDKTAVKRKYYTHLYRFYKGKPSPTDEELYEFEIEMAVNYLEVFYWYFYYHGGYHMKNALSNPYYRYSHPPLYNSLYIVLKDRDPEHLNRFDFQSNRELEPFPTTHAYFEALPTYPRLHHYMVLPKEEFELEYPRSTLMDDQVRKVRETAPKADPDFRSRQQEATVIHTERLDVEAVIRANMEEVEIKAHTLEATQQKLGERRTHGPRLVGLKRFNL